MSLLLWFPLNGDLKNQGIAGQPNFTGTTASYGTGKLGTKALSVNQAQIKATAPELVGVTKFSICYWYKIDATITDISDWADFWQVQSKVGNTTDVIRDELKNNTQIGYDSVYVAKDRTIGTDTNPYYHIHRNNLGANKWCHIAVTKDDNYVKEYVNGNLISTVACSNFESSPQVLTGYFQFGHASGNIVPVHLQDWRLYDNVLSANEIHKISQGLTIHLPLSMSGENLIQTNSLAPTSGTEGWSKAGNGWTLSNVTASGTMNGHAIRCTFSGTTGVSGGIHHLTGIDREDYENGQIYTLQARIRASKGCIATFNNDLMTIGNAINLTTEWKIYSYSCVIDNTRQYFSNIIYVRSSDATDGMWIECEWFKLEIGDKATPWIPSKNDSKYSALGFNSNIVYDVSGYKNNGTITGTLTHNTNTPRFNTCTVFQNDNYIVNNTRQIRLDNEFTISFWYKVNAWDKGWEGAFLLQNTTALNSANGTYSIGSAIHKSTSNIMSLSIRQGGDTYAFDQYKWTYEIGQWNHYACTYNKGVIIIYQNGEQIHSGTISDSCANNYYYMVGKRANLNGDCCISDFRIYNTALSSDDILGLYNTPTSLSRNGTLLTTEYIEGV